MERFDDGHILLLIHGSGRSHVGTSYVGPIRAGAAVFLTSAEAVVGPRMCQPFVAFPK